MAPRVEVLAPSPRALTSTPQLDTTSIHIEPEISQIKDGERVVISGMSGLYPQSRSVKDFCKHLYDKVNTVTMEDSRWNYSHPELSQYIGKAPNLDRFDAQFFKVHFRQSNMMDVMGRKLLEQTYQAIYDAGVCPENLSNKKVAVYVGASLSESERTNFYDTTTRTGFGITGCSKTMFANRISYWLNVKGPSLTIDEACCSASTALEQAYLSISRGDCEAAIVGSTNICLLPQASIHYKRIIDMSKDGKTKSFDQNADGCSNSDAINVIFLQKAKDALRVYAEIMHVKNEFGGILEDNTGPRFGFCRIQENVTNFMNDFYNEAGVPPQAIEYVEAFGSATPDADKTELQAIEDVFLKGRIDPLLVGSVMSNVGFTQAASGITAVTKVLLSYHTGELAANLHFSSPRQDVAAMREGRLRVLTERQPFRRSFIAINGMSFTGMNSHVLLHGRYKPKDLSKYTTSLPRLVLLSGRQESGVDIIIKDLKTRPIDPEELALLHNIHSSNIAGHLGRGFVILDSNDKNETISLCETSQYFDDIKRPLWFVYSGMGSQWIGMGAQLMRIPIFAAAIERCQRILEPKGLDLVHIITSPDKHIFENVLHSFVGIAAVQIGLTDILHALGLRPDGIIGHSVGELGCAYADGCLTAEEMILSAYCRGRVSLETKLIRGSMAAVGIGYEQISKLCPPEIYVACHNGPESSTISGPADKMKEFVAELTSKGIFAKEVPCSNIAYHSAYIADAGPGLLKYLKEVIKNPKPRSERWFSTSVPQDQWEEPRAKLCSAEYHTNNLLNPVLFEETSRLVPNGAVLVEVAPHGLLQAILKRSLPSDCRHVPLTKRGHTDNALHLLQAIGKLYVEGYNPQIQNLYPKIEFPVSTGTPMLSHLVEWVHVEKWAIPNYVAANKTTAACCKFLISTHDEEHKYLKGNVVRGATVYPFAAMFVAVWDTLAMYSGATKRQMSVLFQDVHLYAQPKLYDQRPLKLTVSVQKGTGWFEILDEQYKVAAGYILAKNLETQPDKDKIFNEVQDDLYAKDIYRLLLERDFSYSGEFRCIESANESLCEATLAWRDNWVTLIDGLLQLNVLRQRHDGVTVPTKIRALEINVDKHLSELNLSPDGKVMKAKISEINDFTRCGGISIYNIKFRNITAQNQTELKINLSNVPTNQRNRSFQESTDHGILSEKNFTLGDKVGLESSRIGELNSLRWFQDPNVESSGVSVAVHYVGLNMIDVKKAIDTIAWSDFNNANYGMDFSGLTKSGSRVMGLVRAGAASSIVRAEPELLWPVPVHWNLEDAATVPLAYAHAFYCFKIKTDLQPGMSVLIHGGAGALGQAAIAIALAYQCQVFTTVSNIHKKQFLQKLYPQLQNEFIVCSRDNSFEDVVMSATQGNGCNIVISSVKTELKNASLRCCAFSGTVIDTTQIQNRDDYYFGMFYMTRQRNYAAIDFSSIFAPENQYDRELIQSLLSEGISGGYVRPLSRVTYAPHDAARAFRLLAASRHRGRVLLRIREQTPQTQPRIYCSPDACHLLVCDEQLLGIQLAERLVSRGARKICIVCLNATSYHQLKIRSWRKLGVDIKFFEDVVNTRGGVTALFNDALTLGPLEGVHVVLKIKDKKTDGQVTDLVNNFDAVSRSMCPLLKYFTVISKDNAVASQICISRAKDNLPATMLDLSSLTEPSQEACWRGLVDATESALLSTSPVLYVSTIREQPTNLLQQIQSLTELDISNENVNKTLKEMNVQNDVVQNIRSLLCDTYNISLNDEEVLALTINNIIELNEKTKDGFKPVRGLETFFSYVDSDELLSTVVLVPMHTLTQDATEDDETDFGQTYLCILPGMEGTYNRFRVLCERLKLSAFVLQPGLDWPHETVRETAERYAQVLLNKIGIKDNFYLLGYETGVYIALEVAAILEDRGLSGTIFFIGHAPDELPAVLDEQLCEFESKEQLQDAVIRHMFTLMAGGETNCLEAALCSASTWPQKVSACVRELLGRVPHSAQYAHELIEAALARIVRARSYLYPTRSLRSKLVLLRAATAHAPPPTTLQQLSQQPVAVHQLSAPLAHAACDMQVTAIINKYLDSGILQLFENKNRCQSYTINSDVFVTKLMEQKGKKCDLE